MASVSLKTKTKQNNNNKKILYPKKQTKKLQLFLFTKTISSVTRNFIAFYQVKDLWTRVIKKVHKSASFPCCSKRVLRPS